MFSDLFRALTNFLKPALNHRFNRAELWFCIASFVFYGISLSLMSFGDNPTQYSAAFADLQTFFRAVAVVCGGMCLAMLSTRHSVAKADNKPLTNSAIYAVRVLYTIALCFAIK